MRITDWLCCTAETNKALLKQLNSNNCFLEKNRNASHHVFFFRIIQHEIDFQDNEVIKFIEKKIVWRKHRFSAIFEIRMYSKAVSLTVLGFSSSLFSDSQMLFPLEAAKYTFILTGIWEALPVSPSQSFCFLLIIFPHGTGKQGIKKKTHAIPVRPHTCIKCFIKLQMLSPEHPGSFLLNFKFCQFSLNFRSRFFADLWSGDIWDNRELCSCVDLSWREPVSAHKQHSFHIPDWVSQWLYSE